MKIGPVRLVSARSILPAVVLEINDGKITHILPCSGPQPQHLPWAVPAFVDLHIHGMGGFGPQQGTTQALLDLSEVLARQGVAAFCPTLYSARPEQMAAQLRALVPALGKEQGARILGFHLEGPFLSPQQLGVMKPQDIAPAHVDDFKKIAEAAQGHISLVTLAPELPGIGPVIDYCAAHHIRVQAGHTHATYEQMQHAFAAGVRRVTHLGNAMRGFHHREPGVLGAALFNPEISCEVIADGKHVHADLLAFLKRVKPISHITAVTDALLPTGQARGPFWANGEEVVFQDGVWKRRSDGVTAGSALTMAGALRQLLQVGYTWPEAVAVTSTNAAQWMQFPGGDWKENEPANFVVLSAQQQIETAFINGREWH